MNALELINYGSQMKNRKAKHSELRLRNFTFKDIKREEGKILVNLKTRN